MGVANQHTFRPGHALTRTSWKPGECGYSSSGRDRRAFEEKAIAAIFEDSDELLDEARAGLKEALKARKVWAITWVLNRGYPEQVKIDVTKTDVQLQLRAQIESAEQLPPEILDELIDARKRFDSAVDRARQLTAAGSPGAGEDQARVIDIAPEVPED